MKYEKSVPLAALRQGELLSNVIETILNLDTIESETQEFTEKVHPYAFVLSQDCDLDWDFAARITFDAVHRRIPNVILCEVQSSESSVLQIMEAEGSKTSKRSRIWSRIMQNKDERYHFFEVIDACDDLYDERIGELVIDFKRFFTVPTSELYMRILRGETKRRCTLVSPYLEHLSSRFGFFQSRVALPEDHESEPGVVKRLPAD